MPQMPEERRRKPAEIAVEQVERRSTFHAWFSRAAAQSSQVMGSPWIFLVVLAVVVIWAVTGPMFHFSNTWQLIINTTSSVVTLLMVFLIQNTQNRDAKAIHLKLNELIHSLNRAHNELIDVEKLSDEELKELDSYYARIREESERRHGRGSDSKDAA